MMDDDPDDLAAAFFAQQAAKEKAKATLPTDDWVRAIEAKQNNKQSSTAAAGSDSDVVSSHKGAIDPSSWLVTKMPSAPTYADGIDSDGVVGIVLDSNLGKTSLEGAQTDIEDGREMTAAETEMRRKIKDSLVQKLEETMKKI